MKRIINETVVDRTNQQKRSDKNTKIKKILFLFCFDFKDKILFILLGLTG